MIGRRGFLGTLLAGAGLVAADPERALWKPGKLISIPPRVHVPQWHSFCVTMEMPEFPLLEIEAPYLWNTQRYLERRYDEPAAAALEGRVHREIAKSGTARRATFAALGLPKAVEFVHVGPKGRLPTARVLQCYDVFHGYRIRRMDVLVRI